MAEQAKPEGEGEQPEPTPAPEPAAGKTFTQAELDAIVQDRLARDRKNQPSKDELKALQAKAAELDELKNAGASELEKAQQAAQKAEAKAAEAIKTANERLLKSSVLAELAKTGVTNAEAAFRAIDKTALTVADDGTVSGVEDAVKSLLEEIPALVGKGSSGSADGGARGAGPEQITQKQLESMSPFEVNKNLKEHKLDHLLKG